MHRQIFVIISSLVIFSSTAPAETNTRYDLEKTALQYFLDHTHPVSGLVRDKAEGFAPTPASNDVASIATTGFGLAITANAAQRGWLNKKDVQDQFTRTMIFCRDRVPRLRGWFIHFMNWETGASTWDEVNDYSSIDTAIFIAGALYAARIFPNSWGARIAQQLYDEMDFDWMRTDGGRFPDRMTLNIGYYFKDGGFTQWQWSIYAEQKLLILLGLGSRTNPLPAAAWDAWERRVYKASDLAIPDTDASFVAMDMPLFIHQYSQVFVDFRQFHDRYPGYWETGALATAFHRLLGDSISRATDPKADPKIKSPEGFWGVSAGEMLDSDGKVKYKPYSPRDRDGTVCIGCAIGSAMYDPAMVLGDAEKWRRSTWGQRIWSKYGFVDSVNVRQNWASTRVLGITVGTAYMSVANITPESSFFTEFMRIPEIQIALKKIAK